MQSKRVSLLLRIGELQATKIGDGEKAFDAYARAFREDPSTTTARTELERLATISEAWPQLVALYEAALEKLKPEGADGGALARAADQGRRGVRREAGEAGEGDRVLPAGAGDRARRPAPALEALERLYTRNERWPELLEVYRKKVELSPEPQAREQIYFRMAYLWEEMLGNVDEAIATYKEVLGARQRQRQGAQGARSALPRRASSGARSPTT